MAANPTADSQALICPLDLQPKLAGYPDLDELVINLAGPTQHHPTAPGPAHGIPPRCTDRNRLTDTSGAMATAKKVTGESVDC